MINKVLTFGKKQKTIFFKSTSICGYSLPELQVNEEEVLGLREELIEEGLLNQDDDLLHEIECDFYKQMIHRILIDKISSQKSKVG